MGTGSLARLAPGTRTSSAGFPPILGALIPFNGVEIPAHAQNAAKIVAQYLRAAGGAKAISRTQTMAIPQFEKEQDRSGLVGPRTDPPQGHLANRSHYRKWSEASGVFRCRHASDRGREGDYEGIDETIAYIDYRVVDGVKVPYHQLKRGDATYQVAVTRAEINGAIPEHVFDFPAKSQVKLPDVKALFEKIDQNQKAIDKIKENYTGTRTEEETEYDGTRKVKKVDTNKFTFFYLNGEEVSFAITTSGGIDQAAARS